MPQHNKITISDSTQNSIKLQIKNEQPSIQLNKMVHNIDLSALNRAIDSSKIKKIQKPIKITKVAPIIKQDSLLPSPTYNTFNNKFEFPTQKKELADNFYFSLPNTSVATEEEKAQKIKTTNHNTKDKAQTIDATSNKQIADRNSKKTSIIVKPTNNKIGFEKTDWTLSFILPILLIFGIINFKFSKSLKSLINAGLRYLSAKHLTESRNVVNDNVFIILNLLFLVNTSFLFTLWAHFNNIKILSLSNYKLFLMFFSALSGIYIIKWLLFNVLDFIFKTKKAFSSYINTIFLYNKIYGIVLIPIISLIPFVEPHITKWLFLTSFILLLINYLARILRGLKIALINKVSILYLILYLCTLEIFPLLIAYHTIMIHAV